MLSYKAGQLCIEGSSVKTLADELGTPFFLFSEARLRANYAALARGLSRPGAEVTIRYCAKVNNEAAILTLLASCGSAVLVSHLAEAQLALRCGFQPGRIAYQRPVIDKEEVRRILEAGVTFVHASRLHDLHVLEKIGSELGRNIRVSLRVRDDFPGSRFSPLKLLSRRLGFEASDVLTAAEVVRHSKWLSLAAINVYHGTQLEAVSSYRSPLRLVTGLAAKVQARLGLSLEEINLGGGMPSPSLRRLGFGGLGRRPEHDRAFQDFPRSLEEFAGKLSFEFFEAVDRTGLQPLPAMSVEPGRSIVGNAAILVARVRAVDRNWIFLDASHNYLPESAVLFSRAVLPVTRSEVGTERHYHLSGSTLNTLDVIGFRRRLPILREGDLVALCDAGAYSLSRASRYAGLCPAAYLIGVDGSRRMIRRAEDVCDLMAPMVTRPDGEATGSD